jgi:hypothetical protein
VAKPAPCDEAVDGCHSPTGLPTTGCCSLCKSRGFPLFLNDLPIHPDFAGWLAKRQRGIGKAPVFPGLADRAIATVVNGDLKDQRDNPAADRTDKVNSRSI